MSARPIHTDESVASPPESKSVLPGQSGSDEARRDPYMYLNFTETRRDPASFWEAQAYRRLRRVKSAVDPGDVIRSNHTIPLAR